MALIECIDCGKQISDKAEACIHCGCPMESNDELIEKSDDNPQFEVGLIDVVGKYGDPYVYKIRTVDGYHVMTDENTQILDLNDESNSLSELEISALVYFKSEFVDGRLKTIYYSNDLPDWLHEIPSFQPANRRVKNENISVEQTKFNDEKNDDGKVTKNYLRYLIVLVIVAGYWIAKGTPNPALFFAGSSAKEECLNLANENKGTLMLNNNEVTANDTWLKDGKRVVQLLQKDEDNGVNQIMCIYGNGMVQIPSFLEQGRWR